MNKLFLFLLLGSLSVASAGDTDLDGVDDINDKCPNTPFSDLSDTNGCTTTSLYTPTYYDIIMGYNYASSNYNTLEDTKTSSATLQADIYHGNLSAQLLASYFTSADSSTSDSGWNDTQLSLFYAFKPTSSLMIQAGLGIILPTYSTGYNNEATDYSGSLFARYLATSNINLFGGYNYTLINDTDIPGVASYQNTHAFYGGVGYVSSKIGSINLSYANSQSIYSEVDPIETLSVGTIIPLDSHWFVLGDYRYGLSDSASDHEAALRVGYTF
ncbi:MAG: DUF3187 domain-containing protein [Sulfuricurvum sp.]